MEDDYPKDRSTADTTLRSEIDSTNTDLDGKMDALKAKLDSDIANATLAIAGRKCFR